LNNAFYAAKRAEAMDKSAEATLRNAEAAQDRQITERFAKAIEQSRLNRQKAIAQPSYRKIFNYLNIGKLKFHP